MPTCIHLHERDNVLVTLEPLAAGQIAETAGGVSRVVRQDIPFAHKLALHDLALGEAVIKYGEPIGVATIHITAGDHVHIHNIRSLRIQGEA